MTRWTGAFATATLVALFALACGKTDAGGGAGSETHWLTECTQDSDCKIGSCLCGVCTVACNSLRDCPEPLDVCSAESTTGACEQKVCGSTALAESQQGLLSASPPTIERHPACEHGRATEITNVDVGYRPSSDDDPVSAAATLIPESPQGFLMFGVTQSFYRIDGAGNLVRTLPAPKSAFDPIYDDAVPLDDGSLILSGHTASRAWVGKVDAAWNMVWEHELDMIPARPTVVVATADGGTVVFTLQGEPNDGKALSAIESLAWTHVSAEGEALWQHQEATMDPRIVALGGDNIRFAVTQDNGIHVFDCDLEGNYDLAPLIVPGGTGPARLLRLPDDRVGLAHYGGFVILDAANQVVSESQIDTPILDAAYDATREQIYLVGHGNNGSRLNGALVDRLNLNGTSTWTFLREEWPNGGRDRSLDGPDWSQYAYRLEQVAVDAAGNVAARSPLRSPGLDIMWLDQGSCGAESVP